MTDNQAWFGLGWLSGFMGGWSLLTVLLFSGRTVFKKRRQWPDKK